MKWEGQEQSDNVRDARGASGWRLPVGRGGLGIGGIVIALVVSWLFGLNPMQVLGLMGGLGTPADQTSNAQLPAPPAQDRSAAFVSTVLRDTELVWQQVFKEANATYQPPALTLFSGRYPTACGLGQAAMGPFYCPGDQNVYLDLSFFEELSRKLGAPGDFAQAYVIAHEVGHHVQHLTGISNRVHQAQQRGNPAQANALSVRLELQADCYAGLWAARSQQGKGWLEQGDLEEAIHAASRIGDDTLQREATGTVRPDAFTHGTSAQRMHWFKAGYTQPQLSSCDTFQMTKP